MSDGQIERRAGLGRVLWSNRRRILTSTCALGLAAFLAGTLVPPVHRVSIHIDARPERSARWTEPALRAMLSSLAPESEKERPGILAAWADLIDHASTVSPDVGASRLDDGSLLVWAENSSVDTARRQAGAIADRLLAEETARAPQTPKEEPDATAAHVLESSVEAAREALATAKARLAEAEAALPAAGDDAGDGRAALDVDRRAAEEAREALRRLERFAGDLPNASPQDAPPAVRDRQEWADWRDAAARRDRAAAQVADLSRTLLDGHPRMAIVRLHLSDRETEVNEARGRLAQAIERSVATLRAEMGDLERKVSEGEARLGGDAAAGERIREAEAERDAAQRTLDALEDALRAAERTLRDRPPATVIAPPTPLSREVSETERRPTIWPIVAASAAFGFLASALYALAGARRFDSPPTAMPSPGERPGRGHRRGTMRPDISDRPERPAAGPAFDVASAEELIGGILASEISRLVLVPLSPETCGAAVEIVRRLALRGRQVALVDLGEEQLAARAMGVAPDALGVSDMIGGEATFAEIARRDFATQAEAFGKGRATIGEAAFLAMERRNVLEFIERNYEITLVLCGGLPLETVKALLTSDSALVVTVDAANAEATAAGVQRLREAGLSDMILADGGQLTP